MNYITARRGAVHLAHTETSENTLCGRSIGFNRMRRCEDTEGDTEFATCLICVERVQPWHIDGGRPRFGNWRRYAS